MSENLKDILSNLNPDIDQETLLLYLQGKLSPAQQHEVEKGMMDDDFENDALEGLSDFKDQQKLSLLVDQLKADLKKKTEKKNKLRKKLELNLDPSIIVALVLILLLVIISYFVIHYYMKR
jgi:ABC-type Na+ efflux pump permease subunit